MQHTDTLREDKDEPARDGSKTADAAELQARRRALRAAAAAETSYLLSVRAR
jgi:tRNA U34 5-methylaminomethyl-2-thiouridine-forming methyltransferase MnmC